jgi:hypothetical protein
VNVVKSHGDRVADPVLLKPRKVSGEGGLPHLAQSKHLTVLVRGIILNVCQLQPNRRLLIASMAKDMMQSGKDLDAMEHGADMKHGVQPSEPSRGTGMLTYAACVGTSTMLCACV